MDTYSMYANTKKRQAQATRMKLESIGRRLFAERGFAGVSAEELVAAAKVTRGALYHHYDGKDGLFATIVENVMKEVHAKLAKRATKQSDPLRALRLGIEEFLKICTQPSIQRILLVDAPTVLGWQKWREMDAHYGMGLLKSALSVAMRAKQIRNQDVDVLAHLLLGAMTEAAMVIARSSKQAAARNAAKRALASIVDGWRASD